jgi:hypothetical protein
MLHQHTNKHIHIRNEDTDAQTYENTKTRTHRQTKTRTRALQYALPTTFDSGSNSTKYSAYDQKENIPILAPIDEDDDDDDDIGDDEEEDDDDEGRSNHHTPFCDAFPPSISTVAFTPSVS